MTDQSQIPQAPRSLASRHPRAAVALSLLVIAASAAWLTWFFWPMPTARPPTRAWYTVDDGATWFADDAERIPPFEHDGKQAVRLHLFTCDGGKTAFVGYLQKIPEETFAQLRRRGVDPATIDDDVLAGENGWLCKRPGAENPWVSSRDDTAYRGVVAVRCPEGGSGTPREVVPPEPKRR
jgi:hypothetical protein